MEGCRTLEDLHRHAHVAAVCDGSDCLAPAALLMSELLSWTPERTRAELDRLLDRLWITRRPALQGATIAQEELLRSLWG
jgi:hypothetical protein